MNLFIIYNFWIGLGIYWANGQPSNRKEDEWFKEQWPTQPYAFGYEIRDYNGNEQYRKEMSDGDRVTGSYGYLGPDGLYRHVEYIADINGFRAKIRTSEPGTANDDPSNVQIESNPILVLPNPSPVGPVVTPGTNYGDITPNPNPSDGYRRDGIRRPPERPPINVNPNRSTYANQPPISPQMPRIPEPPRGPNTQSPMNRDRFDTNRGPEPDIPLPIKPNFEDPSLRSTQIGSTRGGQRDDRVNFADIPENVMPYRGANPKRPVVEDSPRDTPRFNDPRQGQGGLPPDSGGNRRGDPRNVRPPYAVREPQTSSQPPVRPLAQPYDRGYDRNRNQIPDDNRDPIRRPEDRGYEVTTRGGSSKTPPKDMGFIEATKGPISPYRPQNKFYDRPSAVFDDDNEYDDQFKRRQDDDKDMVVVNKPVFENRDTPRKIGGFVRSRYNTTRPEARNGVKTKGAPQTQTSIRDSFNKTLNESSFDANQGRRDSIDKKVRRPTKVFVTSGPISGIPDNRVTPNEGDNRSYDVHQRHQHIDIDYDNKKTRDGQQIGLDGIKGQTDRDQPLPPTRREQTPQNIKPYYGGRRDDPRELSVPKQPQETPSPRLPVVPYDPRMEQQHMQTPDEDIPIQRDNDFPKEEQPVRPMGPQIYQPLRPNHRPNHRPDRQPLPRRPERPYKPRTQSQDRQYDEQQIEVQPYQTQNSASITSPVNTIPTAYKPVDSLEDENLSEEEKPNQNTPLSPSSYIVTPFPINETNIQIKPIIVNRPEVHTYTVVPELNQMEVPKFGTRLNTPEPPTQEIYKTIDEVIDDDKVDQQNDYNYNNDENDPNLNQNVYQNVGQNDDQNIDIPNDNQNDNQNLNPQQIDNIDNDQYYAYYEDQSQDVESKDSPKSVIYTQSTAHKNDEKLNINSNNSSPIEIRHQITNLMNWHEYDSSSGHTLNQ